MAEKKKREENRVKRNYLRLDRRQEECYLLFIFFEGANNNGRGKFKVVLPQRGKGKRKGEESDSEEINEKEVRGDHGSFALEKESIISRKRRESKKEENAVYVCQEKEHEVMIVLPWAGHVYVTRHPGNATGN